MNAQEKTFQPRNMRTVWFAATALLLAGILLVILLTTGEGGRVYPVYISEILASNTAYPNGDGRCADYIELYNSADYPLDLSNFQLGDIAGSRRYVFPKGSSIGAHSYLVIYCDSSVDEAGYAPFNISRSGDENLYLVATNGAIVDQVTTVATDMNQAMTFTADGQLQLTDAPTPGKANDSVMPGQDIYNSGISPVRITEFSSADNGYAARYDLLCDWVELHNTDTSDVDISGYIVTDNVGNDKFRIPQGTVIPAGGYHVIYCSTQVEADDIAPFGLSRQGGDSLVLKNERGMIVELVYSPKAEKFGSMALRDGSWDFTAEPTPGFDNTPDGYRQFLNTINAQPGSVYISELMAGEQYVLPNSFGEFSDWCELYNPGSVPVNLTGWYLSDNPDQPTKWQIPALTIQPGQYRIIFLSGRDTVIGDEIHSSFSLSASGESLVLSSYLGTTVDSVTFGNSPTNCSYVCSFGDTMLSDMPTPGYPNDQTGYHALCDANIAQGPLAIWEVMTANDWYLPQKLGKCYDWVELRNVSNQTVQLSDYCLTDDPDSPDMYRLPDRSLEPGKTTVIILSGDTSLSNKNYTHAPIKLNAKEDQLFLYSYAEGKLVDYVFVKGVPVQHSYGRSEDQGGFSYMTPTPGKNNASGYRQISAKPTSDRAAGVYTGESGFTVPLSAAGTIYYTLDGSDPDQHSRVYDGPIRINSTTVLRATAVENGKMPSSIYTATFIIQEPHSIPVVSLVTDPDNLWGSNGIYKNGDIKVKEEKRSANISYTGPDGSFSLDCEMSLHGATTVKVQKKKSFVVRFRDNYDGPLNYDLFEDGEVTSFSSMIVRAAHESTISSHMRDALMGQIASENCDTLSTQKHKFVALYLNGEYWGLYAFREQMTAEHYASYMNVPVDSVSKVRYASDENNSLNRLYQFLKSNNLRSTANFERAKSILDLSSFADWIIFQAYVGNFDLNENNRYFYSTADGLWRCGLVDVDLGMFRKPAFSEMVKTFHHGRLISALLQNKEFQDLIAKRLAELLAGPLSDENMLKRIDQMADSIRDEIPLEGKRWGYTLANWEKEVQAIRKYCTGRASYMIRDFCDVVGFTQSQKQSYFGQLLK